MQDILSQWIKESGLWKWSGNSSVGQCDSIIHDCSILLNYMIIIKKKIDYCSKKNLRTKMISYFFYSKKKIFFSFGEYSFTFFSLFTLLFIYHATFISFFISIVLFIAIFNDLLSFLFNFNYLSFCLFPNSKSSFFVSTLFLSV